MRNAGSKWKGIDHQRQRRVLPGMQEEDRALPEGLDPEIKAPAQHFSKQQLPLRDLLRGLEGRCRRHRDSELGASPQQLNKRGLDVGGIMTELAMPGTDEALKVLGRVQSIAHWTLLEIRGRKPSICSRNVVCPIVAIHADQSKYRYPATGTEREFTCRTRILQDSGRRSFQLILRSLTKTAEPCIGKANCCGPGPAVRTTTAGFAPA